MTKLIQRMREELVRRNFAESTMRTYLQVVEDFRRYSPARLDQRGPDDIRRYQVYLLEERKLCVDTVVSHIAALRFFYVKTLKRPAMKQDLPYPNRQRLRLPTILTPEEVSKLIDSARNLFHYAMLLTMYSAGLRRSELCKLKVNNIDSGRMVIRVERGKGGVDREVPLNPKLLTTLREYWRWMRPKTYLFPGTRNGWRADKPITPKVIWEAVQHAARKAGIQKHVTPHTLRHASAYYTTFQSSFILKAIGLDQAQSAAVYGRNGRLAPVPARLAARGPVDR
ncbi:MAG: site-specific integrase [Acidobacteriaceae bacterium]|nr:site-specific integrase [Acidobacteriaceae bacterium]